MRDYEAEAILEDDHQQRKTRYQRGREAKISENETLYMAGGVHLKTWESSGRLQDLLWDLSGHYNIQE